MKKYNKACLSLIHPSIKIMTSLLDTHVNVVGRGQNRSLLLPLLLLINSFVPPGKEYPSHLAEFKN